MNRFAHKIIIFLLALTLEFAVLCPAICASVSIRMMAGHDCPLLGSHDGSSMSGAVAPVKVEPGILIMLFMLLFAFRVQFVERQTPPQLKTILAFPIEKPPQPV